MSLVKESGNCKLDLKTVLYTELATCFRDKTSPGAADKTKNIKKIKRERVVRICHDTNPKKTFHITIRLLRARWTSVFSNYGIIISTYE